MATQTHAQARKPTSIQAPDPSVAAPNWGTLLCILSVFCTFFLLQHLHGTDSPDVSEALAKEAHEAAAMVKHQLQVEKAERMAALAK